MSGYIVGAVVLLIAFAVACGAGAQPPATITPVGTAPSDQSDEAIQSVLQWLGGNSSDLVAKIATTLLELGPAQESEPGTIEPILKLIKAVEIEAQLGDSIEWEIQSVSLSQGRYEATVVGTGEIVVEVPLAGGAPLTVRGIVTVGMDGESLAVDQYAVTTVTLSAALALGD